MAFDALGNELVRHNIVLYANNSRYQLGKILEVNPQNPDAAFPWIRLEVPVFSRRWRVDPGQVGVQPWQRVGQWRISAHLGKISVPSSSCVRVMNFAHLQHFQPSKPWWVDNNEYRDASMEKFRPLLAQMLETAT